MERTDFIPLYFHSGFRGLRAKITATVVGPFHGATFTNPLIYYY